MYSDQEVMNIAFRRWGIQLHKEGRQFIGPCPFCNEGSRSLVVWSDGNFWCNKYGTKGWLNDDQPNWKPSAEQAEQTKQRLAAQAKAKEQLLRSFQTGPREHQLWEWHAGMSSEHWQYWRDAGISDEYISEFALGYNPDKIFELDNERLHLTAYTIPIRNLQRQLVNVQYRLNGLPPVGKDGKVIGKYRQEHGLDASPFFPQYELCREEELTITEGTKKGLVVYAAFERAMQIAALPGSNPSLDMLDQFKGFKRINLILDPDAMLIPTQRGSKEVLSPAERIARYLHPSVYLVRIPVKVDDAIVKYGMTANELLQYIRQGEQP